MAFVLAPPATPVGEIWDLASGILHTHHVSVCKAYCSLHNPSPHHMLAWPLSWDTSHRRMNRICPDHNEPHPDPDDIRYRASIGLPEDAHDCCGCCL